MPIAPKDIINLNSVMSTSKSLAVNNDKPCERSIPSKSPATKDKLPTIKVSLNNIFDILLFFIPSVI